MEQKEIVIDTSNISPYRAMGIGRAFYHAYMEFIKDPENEKMIEKRAEEIRKEEEDKAEREAESFEKSKSIKIV